MKRRHFQRGEEKQGRGDKNKRGHKVNEHTDDLIVLVFFPRTENSAKTPAPPRASISPCRLVKLRVKMLPCVTMTTMPKKLMNIEQSFLTVDLSLRRGNARIMTSIEIGRAQ